MTLEVLETYRALVGPETAEVARVWHLIGLARLGSSDARRGKEANEQALAIRRKVLPRDHPRIAANLYNLGLAQQRLEQYAAAKGYYEQALAIERKALPPNLPHIADSLNNLGIVQQGSARVCGGAEEPRGGAGHLSRGPTGERREHRIHSQCSRWATFGFGTLRRRGRAMRKRWPPAVRPYPRTTPASPLTFTTWGMCRGICGGTRRRARAMRRLAFFRRARPPGHPDVANGLIGLGTVQYELREYAAARKSYEEAGHLPPGSPSGPPRRRRRPDGPGARAVESARVRSSEE